MGQNSCCCAHHAEQGRNPYLWPGLAFVMLAAGMVFRWTLPQGAVPVGCIFLWYLTAYLLVGLPVLREAWENFCRKDYFNEFSLMALATIGAFYIGEYPEGVAVMLFYTFGEILQQKAVGKARKGIADLLDVRPETVRVRVGKEYKMKAPSEVGVGEMIEVRPGERVPLDGELLSPAVSFDASALTGESLPRMMVAGGEVLAGMLAVDRVAKVLVSRPYAESVLARVIRMVEEASERKAPAELLIRRFARVYTPVVTGLAALTVLFPWLVSLVYPDFSFVFDVWFYRALVFLVLSCPCALVVSIPLGYYGGIGAASRWGILFKGSNYLDAVAKVNTVVFDKTGTLTNGIFEVQQVHPEEGMSEKQLLQIIASAEVQSNHPLALAVVRYARKWGIDLLALEELSEIAGFGLTGSLHGRKVLVGNIRLLDRFGVDYPAGLVSLSETLVCCAVDGQFGGYILLADNLKADAQEAIMELRKLGIRYISILSGDSRKRVECLGASLGGIAAEGELLPGDKVQRLVDLKTVPGRRIAFVGDGINDAPVLATSDVGIAMGQQGSDIAIETAGVVIHNDRLTGVAAAIRIGRQTRSIIRQNIAWAFAVKLIVLVLGAAGMATLWEAVFADTGAALIAIANAVRIQRKAKPD